MSATTRIIASAIALAVITGFAGTASADMLKFYCDPPEEDANPFSLLVDRDKKITVVRFREHEDLPYTDTYSSKGDEIIFSGSKLVGFRLNLSTFKLKEINPFDDDPDPDSETNCRPQ